MVAEKQRGFLIVLVGPGGAGKNAIMAELLQRVSGLKKLVTATTRQPRGSEQEGHDHYFVSLDQFEKWRDEGRLLEHTEVTPGKFYGIVREKVDSSLNEGIDLIADIDVKGADVLMKTYPDDIVPVFVTAAETPEQALSVLRERMARRGDPAELIQQRIDRALAIEYPFYDENAKLMKNIINSEGQMEDSIGHIHTLIQQERAKRGRTS